jgi:glycosyltransferase involved in cell wall biosynthesis
VATQGEKYKGFLMRSLVALGASVFHLWTKRMAKGALVFVTGSQLHLELAPLAKRCVSIIPSVISGSDIFWRENSCETLPIQLLYVGRLVPVKGLRYLLGAVKLLQDRGIEVKLQLVGGGAQKAELIAQAADLGVTERVTFTGRVPFGPDLLARYRQADIFILPSLSEGVPKTLLEAMASGLPVVATRVGGVPDVVCDNETGILVNPRAPDELAHAVERLIMDPKLRKTMIENAYVFVGEHTVEKQAGRMWQEIRDSFHLEDE